MSGSEHPVADIDVVVVHYARPDDLERCLEALRGARELVAQVSVIDNGSPRPLPEGIRDGGWGEVSRLPENLGFARAANLGAAAGRGELVLFLNPDVRLDPAVLSGLRRTLQSSPTIAAVAPNLVREDGASQPGAAGYLPTMRSVLSHSLCLPGWLPGGFGRPFMLRVDPGGGGALGRSRRGERPVPVEWLSAACLLVRRGAFEEVGGFDGSFFLYGEDVDLGHRLTAAGWCLAFHPELTVLHAHSPDEEAGRAPVAAWIDGLDLYYRKHRRGSRRLLHAVAATGFLGRAAARALQGLLPGGKIATRRMAVRLSRYAGRSARLALSPRR